MSLVLRPATSEDIPALVEVINSGMTNKVRRGDLAWGDKALVESDIRPFVERGSTYVACLDDHVVGTFVLDWQDTDTWGPQPPDAGYIQRFAVDSSQRGQSIGSQMLGLAETEVVSRGGHFVRLFCPAANPGLRAYYEKQGFTRADAKAKPRAYQPVVYYERAVAGHTEATSTAQQTKPLSRFKRFFSHNSE